MSEVIGLFEPLSSWKKGTSAILLKIKSELSKEGLVFYENWTQKYKWEIDIIIALWRWEEEANIILADLSPEVQQLIQNFTQKKVDYLLQLSDGEMPFDKWDTL